MNLRKEFYVAFKNDDFDSFLVKHIQYNIQHKISLFKYNKYRRINIVILVGDDKNEIFDVTWNDNRTANISIFCKREFVSDLEAKTCIEFIYDLVFKAIEILWKENRWDVKDLISIQKEIKSDDYKVTIPISTALRLPDKKGRVSIVCKIYPRFSEYFFRVENKKDVQTVQFFRGISDPILFFLYFSVFKIKDDDSVLVSDAEGELNHVLNLTNYEYQRIYAPKINSLGNCKKIMEAFESADPKEILRVMKL
jgi:hypothetical protein